MSTKSPFSFKAYTAVPKNTSCPAPVAASVRASRENWVCFRINKETSKTLQIKPGTLLSPFIDEPNRAILLLSDQRPTPVGARKVSEKDSHCFVEFPRKHPFDQWFPKGRILPMEISEASPGRLVIVAPKAP